MASNKLKKSTVAIDVFWICFEKNIDVAVTLWMLVHFMRSFSTPLKQKYVQIQQKK